MNIIVEGTEPVIEANVGDIIEYEVTSHRFHPFYMVCHIEDKGYFVMSLTGQKTKARFYQTIKNLMSRQSQIKKVYSRQEWQMKLTEISS